MSSKNGSSVHGLLTDADSVDDDMELIDLQKKTGSGVEVSFNGKKSTSDIKYPHTSILAININNTLTHFSDRYFNYCMLLDVSFHYPEQPVEKVTTCHLICSTCACTIWRTLPLLSYFRPILLHPSLSSSFIFFPLLFYSPLFSSFLPSNAHLSPLCDSF
jgi:hypothetical protein